MYSQRFALSLEVASQLPSRFFNLTRRCHLSATAYLLYHSVNRLSTTFLFSFASFSEAVVVCVTYFTRQLIHNIMYRSVCQQLFQKKIEQLISSNKAEKEGFEPSRRY